MLNYIKSECYRMRTGKGFYLAIAILGGLVLLMNIVLALFGHFDPNFPYGTVRFSLNTFTAMIYNLMVAFGSVVPGCLFIEERRNGVMKTVIASGLSREKMFIGKCIVAFLHTFVVMCAVLVIYVGSAYALLAEPEWLPLREMLTGIAAVLPIATGALISIVLLGILFRQEITASIIWAVIWFVVPMVTAILGLKVEAFARLASWMPEQILKTEAIVRFASYDCLWDTAQGFAKCWFVGAIGIAVFLAVGLWSYRKIEV